MKSIFSLIICVVLVFSCSINDDDNQQTQEPILNGSWSLTNVSGGLLGAYEDFEMNLIVWDFDTDNWVLTVNNNNTDAVIFDGLPSGTYDYQLLSTTGEETYLAIDGYGVNLTTSFNSETEMVLDEGIALDGFLLTFNK